MPAKANDRRTVLIAGTILSLIFLATVPFARLQLPEFWAFIPIYQGPLALSDLLTAALLYWQAVLLRSHSMVLLADGYLFSALIAVVHALTFPGLFAPEGLLGAGPQTTAWLYMFWHGGFPALVVAYGLIKDRNGAAAEGRSLGATILVNVAAVVIAVAVLALIATGGRAALPPIMAGNHYTPQMVGVVTAVWACSFAAFLVLWLRMPHSVLDIWLMLTMVSWMFDVALAAVLNAGRFDVGFYAGRIYGLAAATFVLIVLLVESWRERAR